MWTSRIHYEEMIYTSKTVTHLHFPSMVTGHPFGIYATHLLRSSIHFARSEIYTVMKQRMVEDTGDALEGITPIQKNR
jgi:hypothetical protein